MQAIELVKSAETREPAADETKQITQYCYEHGLITITAGSYSNVIRVLVPLVVTDEQMDEALDVLEAALQMVERAARRGGTESRRLAVERARLQPAPFTVYDLIRGFSR